MCALLPPPHHLLTHTHTQDPVVTALVQCFGQLRAVKRAATSLLKSSTAYYRDNLPPTAPKHMAPSEAATVTARRDAAKRDLDARKGPLVFLLAHVDTLEASARGVLKGLYDAPTDPILVEQQAAIVAACATADAQLKALQAAMTEAEAAAEAAARTAAASLLHEEEKEREEREEAKEGEEAAAAAAKEAAKAAAKAAAAAAAAKAKAAAGGKRIVYAVPARGGVTCPECDSRVFKVKGSLRDHCKAMHPDVECIEVPRQLPPRKNKRRSAPAAQPTSAPGQGAAPAAAASVLKFASQCSGVCSTGVRCKNTGPLVQGRCDQHLQLSKHGPWTPEAHFIPAGFQPCAVFVTEVVYLFAK